MHVLSKSKEHLINVFYRRINVMTTSILPYDILTITSTQWNIYSTYSQYYMHSDYIMLSELLQTFIVQFIIFWAKSKEQKNVCVYVL